MNRSIYYVNGNSLNKMLHWTTILLRFIAASELDR